MSDVVDVAGALVETKITVEQPRRKVQLTLYNFIKFPEARPLKDKKAETVALFIFEENICRYGCVQIKITDKGKEFCNEISEAPDKITGVKHNITSAYHPQSNGLVQRMNRTLKGILIKRLGEDGDWVKDLQPVLFSYRTSKHSSTRKTPYEVLFHKKAILPIDVKEDSSDTFQKETFRKVI